MATKKENQTAADVCRERRADCQALLSHLGELIGAKDEGEESWPQAGSLGHLRELLVEAVSFYGGLDSENIDEVLAELRGQ